MKCVLSIKEANFNEKMGSNFHICLGSGPRGLTVKYSFFMTSLCSIKKRLTIFQLYCYSGKRASVDRIYWTVSVSLCWNRKRNYLTVPDRKTPSARQQCWPESFCESAKFLQQAHYLLKNFQIFWKMSGYYTKYPDNMQS